MVIMNLTWTKPSFSVKTNNRMSVVQLLDIRIRLLFLCSFSNLRWVKVQGVKMIDLFE